MRADIIRLVREKRYEEALALLGRARAEWPEDNGLTSTIAPIKDFLPGAAATPPGGLDREAPPLPPGTGHPPHSLPASRAVVGTSRSDMRVNGNPYWTEYLARWTVRNGAITYFGEYFDPARLVVALGGRVVTGSVSIA